MAAYTKPSRIDCAVRRSHGSIADTTATSDDLPIPCSSNQVRAISHPTLFNADADSTRAGIDSQLGINVNGKYNKMETYACCAGAQDGVGGEGGALQVDADHLDSAKTFAKCTTLNNNENIHNAKPVVKGNTERQKISRL